MKQQLRKDVLRERMALSPAEVSSRSSKICAQLMQMPQFNQARTVMFFIDFRNEVTTGEAIKAIIALGKRVVVPITDIPNRKLTPSQIVHFPEDLQSGAYGILEPKPECVRPVPPQEIDFVAVPGVAFDVQGNRLGYGGGFYDRFLRRVKPGATLVALAFELQIKEEVYPEAHDYPLHWIITEKRLIKC
ncbi:MAG: 5-formyltetrahydrofolate cyclo-ligase [Carboxydocellales bacterium]